MSFFISFQTTRGEPLSIVLESETHKSMVAWIRKNGQEDDSAKFFFKVRWEHVLQNIKKIVGERIVDKASGGHGKTLGSKCLRQYASTILLEKHAEPHQAMSRIGGSYKMARRHYADRGTQSFAKLQEKRLIIGSSSSSSSESPEESETSSSSSDFAVAADRRHRRKPSAPSTASSDGDKTESSECRDSSDDTESERRKKGRNRRTKSSKKGKLMKGQTAKSSNPYSCLEESESSDYKEKKRRTKPSKRKNSWTSSDDESDGERGKKKGKLDEGKSSNTNRSSDTDSDTDEHKSARNSSESESASPPPPAKVVTPGCPSSAVPDTGGGTSQPTEAEAEAEACEALAEDIDVAAGGTTPPSDE